MGGSSVGVSAFAESAAVAAVALLVVLACRMGATLTVWVTLSNSMAVISSSEQEDVFLPP